MMAPQRVFELEPDGCDNAMQRASVSQRACAANVHRADPTNCSSPSGCQKGATAQECRFVGSVGIGIQSPPVCRISQFPLKRPWAASISWEVVRWRRNSL